MGKTDMFGDINKEAAKQTVRDAAATLAAKTKKLKTRVKKRPPKKPGKAASRAAAAVGDTNNAQRNFINNIVGQGEDLRADVAGHEATAKTLPTVIEQRRMDAARLFLSGGRLNANGRTHLKKIGWTKKRTPNHIERGRISTERRKAGFENAGNPATVITEAAFVNHLNGTRPL